MILKPLDKGGAVFGGGLNKGLFDPLIKGAPSSAGDYTHAVQLQVIDSKKNTTFLKLILNATP